MSIILTAVLVACAAPTNVASVQLSSPREHVVSGLPTQLTIKARNTDGSGFCGAVALTGVTDTSGAPIAATPALTSGAITLKDVLVAHTAAAAVGDKTSSFTPRQVDGWLSILPPALAIVLAVVARQALLALFAGIWLGAMFVAGMDPLAGLLRVFDTYLLAAVADPDHAAILLFTVALGGIVGILQKSGATFSMVAMIAKRATSRRAGMITTWFGGLILFFDDYANCLLVGNALRPYTDKLKISREKLAYMVDSTAAPVTTIAVISTWIGFQIGLFDDVLGKGEGYTTFLKLLPYSFYSFFTIAFVLMVAVSQRDFGPMARAEHRAYATGQLVRDGGKPLMDAALTGDDNFDDPAPAWVAVVPLLAVMGIVFAGLYVTGAAASHSGADFRTIIAKADPYKVLLWAAFGGSGVALLCAVGTRKMSLESAVDAWADGARAMMLAVMILVLAWTIGTVCKDQLQTGDWIISHIGPDPRFLPAITFILAAAIALATGSSFSTMAIVVPIAVPMAWQATGDASGLSPDVIHSIRYATLAAVLSGSVFGDHCSPISDTTIMSSMACASDHIDHVRTQFPYAMVCAGAAILIGYIPAGFGITPIVTIPLGLVCLGAFLFFVGKPLPAED